MQATTPTFAVWRTLAAGTSLAGAPRVSDRCARAVYAESFCVRLAM